MHLKAATIASLLLLTTTASSQPLNLDFDQGVESWRVVVDGVMGGRSTGRVTQQETGILTFSGNLSLENNGGFSQIRKNIDEGALTDQDGLEFVVRGDGRTYQFDIRTSNVRLMAGGYQLKFDTTDGEWTTIQLPFDEFRLYSFGRKVPNPPALDISKIESIGVTLADYNTGEFEIEFDSIRSYDTSTITATKAPSHSIDSADQTVIDVARAAGLNTLIDLIDLAEIELPNNEKLTVFAPTEEAFSKLPSETVKFLTSPEGKDTLRSILTYHIAPNTTRSSDLLNIRSLPTLNGQSLSVSLNNSITIAGASIKATDIPFNQGVVHVIDSVLIPESQSILDIAINSDQLSTLVAAVQAAGIEDQLSSENGPWTVFAPANSAFASLPDGVLDSLLKSSNRAALIDTLGLHLVPGRISSNELLINKKARTFFGHTIDFTLRDGQLAVQDAKIIKADIQASNGVVHIIDSVITKNEPKQQSQSQISSTQLNSQIMNIYELAVERGVPLFNMGQHRACASIYEVAIESILALAPNALDPNTTDRLMLALSEASTKNNWSDRAWIYRRALDDMIRNFRSISQAHTRG